MQEELLSILAPRGAVELDWIAYYREFDARHGGDPVQFRGRLLWRDGWTYASTDHAGPEWAPPQDPKELKAFQLAYWSKRKAALTQQLRSLEDDVANLKETQRVRPVPLQIVERTRAINELGFPVMKSTNKEIDFDVLAAIIKDMRTDVAECNVEIRLLKGESDEQRREETHNPM
jgi:hypothetical protein